MLSDWIIAEDFKNHQMPEMNHRMLALKETLGASYAHRPPQSTHPTECGFYEAPERTTGTTSRSKSLQKLVCSYQGLVLVIITIKTPPGAATMDSPFTRFSPFILTAAG